MKQLKSLFIVMLALFFVIFLTLYIFDSLQLNKDLPKGYDTFGHVSQVEFVRKNFPHILWNPYWYLGSMAFPSGYPPLYHASLGLVARITGVSSFDLVREVANGAMLAILASFFGIAYLISRSVFLAVSIPLLLMATGAFWTFILQYGLQVRLAGFALYSLHLLILLAYLKYRNFQLRIASIHWRGAHVLYPLMILLLTAVILTHLFVGVLAILTLSFFIFNLEEPGRKLATWFKTLLISLQLAAFYYIPYLVLNPVGIPLIGRIDDPAYAPIKSELLFQFQYPDLGVWLLIVLFLVMAVKIFKLPASRQLLTGFYFFVFLGLFFVVYSLGIFQFYFLGLYPSHGLFYAAIFLSLAAIFAFASLGKKIIWELPLLLVGVFLTLQFLKYIPSLQPKIAHNSPVVLASFGITNVDETKNYRFAHNREKIGGPFNLFYDGLQTRGYFTQAITFPYFHYWFEQAVFKEDGNLAVSEFLLDWFAIDQVYVGGSSMAAYHKPNFSKLKYSYFYQKKTPIFLATNAPYIFIKASNLQYREINKELAKRGAKTDVVIPLAGSGSGRSEEKRLTVSSFGELEKLVDLGKAKKTSNQDLKAEVVNTGHWEVVLNEPFHGLVFKQSFSANWQARLIDKDGQKKHLKIWMAGPGMMYVILPEFSSQARVVFEYKPSWSYYLGLAISIWRIGMWGISGLKNKIFSIRLLG